MLKTRIMPTLLYRDLGLVKGVGFDSWRRVGAPLQSIKVYNMREVDELVFLDITATLAEREPDFELMLLHRLQMSSNMKLQHLKLLRQKRRYNYPDLSYM